MFRLFAGRGLASGRSLYQCHLYHRGTCWEGAVVFPFFERSGSVRKLMLIMPDGGPAYFLEPDPDLLSVQGHGVVRLHCDPALLPQIQPGDAGVLARLWHWDPWWVLADAPYRHQPWVGAAKASNCPGAFSQIFFDRRLTQVERVVPAGGRKLLRFHMDLMPPPRPRALPALVVPHEWRFGLRWRRSWSLACQREKPGRCRGWRLF